MMSQGGETRMLSVLPRVAADFGLERRIAPGAVCEIFVGRHVGLDVPIAVKVLRAEHLDDEKLVEQMRLEAHVVPRIRSPHVVQCFHRGVTADGRPYPVFEFLDGDTLEVLIERLRGLDELTAIHFGAELCEALSVTHASGDVHRDVSLRNLIIHQPRGEPALLKLIDFGFACVLDDAREGAAQGAAVKTDPDSTVGTPRFMSPEAAQGRAVDGRADL